MNLTDKQRFERHYIVTDSCWLWIASKNKDGYGHFGYLGVIDKAHRVSYRLYIGVIPSGMYVCHSCDNPSCVRPSHLFLGTKKTNIQDASKKNRMAHGIRHKSVTHPESVPRGDNHWKRRKKYFNGVWI